MLVIIWPTLTGSSAAGAVITLGPGADGGVQLTANGSAGAAQFFGFDPPLMLPGDNVIGPDGGDFASATAGGTLVVGSPFGVVSVHLKTTGTSDIIQFHLSSTAYGGPVEFQNVTASWTVSTLAFSSLTPGTYSTTLFEDTTLVITNVPQPSSMMMLLLAASGLAVTKLRRRLA